MRLLRILSAALAALMVLLAGCSKQSAPGASGQTRGPTKQQISVEDAADRLVSELVLFHTTLQGGNLGTVTSLAGRMDISLEERLARAWKSNPLLGFAADPQMAPAMAPGIGVMAAITKELVTNDEADLSKLVKSLSEKIQQQNTNTSKRDLGKGNPQLFKGTIREDEKKFNQSIDEAAAKTLVKLEACLRPQLLAPYQAKLPDLREKLIRVLRADPKLLATMREAMAVERAVPDDLRQSREQADRIIASARRKK